MQGEADQGLLARVTDLYLEHAPRAYDLLKQRGGSDDPAAIAEAAHALKSLSRNIGAVAVAEACGALERQARAAELGNVDAQIRHIGDTLERALAEISHYAADAGAHRVPGEEISRKSTA